MKQNVRKCASKDQSSITAAESDQARQLSFYHKLIRIQNLHDSSTIEEKEAKSVCLTRSFLLSSNSNPLTLQGPAIILCSLSSTWQPLNVPHASVALNLL